LSAFNADSAVESATTDGVSGNASYAVFLMNAVTCV